MKNRVMCHSVLTQSTCVFHDLFLKAWHDSCSLYTVQQTQCRLNRGKEGTTVFILKFMHMGQ